LTVQICWEAGPDHFNGPVIVAAYDDNCNIAHQTQEQFYIKILPGVYAGEDKIYCPGQEVQLDASGSANYSWTSLSGDPTSLFNCTDCPNPLYTPTQPSVFQVEGTSSGNGCSTTDEVELVPTLINNITIADTGCGIEDGSISVEIVDGSGDYSVIFNGTLFDLVGNTFDTTMLGAGIYDLTLIDEVVGCSIFESIEIQAVAGVPEPHISGPNSTCNLSAQLSATVANTSLNWTYNGPGILTFSDATAPDPMVAVSAEGIYMLYLTESDDLLGCAGVDSIQIEFKELESVIAGNDTSICALSYQLQGSATNGTWQWFALGPGTADYSSNDNDPSAIVTVSSFGNYDFLWTFDGVNGCDTSGQVTISFLPYPIAESADTLTFCQLDGNFLSATPAIGGQWTVLSGDLTLNIVDPNSPIESAGYGEFQVVWTVTNGGCSNSDTTLLRYIETEEAIISTTTNQVCGNTTEFAAVNSSGIWSSSNTDLSFSPSNNPLTTVTAANPGGYSIIWTVGEGVCANADNWNIVFFDSAQVDILSLPTDICSSNDLSLTGTASNNISQQWSTSGDGSFDDPNALTTQYILGVNDSINGSVTITLTAVGESVCPAAQQSAIVNIVGTPEVIANASTPTTICSNGTVVLNGNAVNTANILWTSSGDGQFLATPTMDDPTYFPGPIDISNGSATLTITGNPLNAICPVVDESIEILIIEAPSAGVDSSISICISASPISVLDHFGIDADPGGIISDINGSGAFDGVDFDPSIAGLGAFQFTYNVLGSAPCSESQSTLTISVTAGPNAGTGTSLTLCDITAAIDLFGELSDSPDPNGMWIDVNSSGGLSGSDFDPSLAGPGEFQIDYVASILGCLNDTSSIQIEVSTLPIIDAGPDSIVICETQELNLSAIAMNQDSVLWSSSGDGTFLNDQALITSYSPGPMDIANGNVTISIAAYGQLGCPDSSDQVNMEISTPPFAGSVLPQ
jgi:hypothetical protein